MTRNHGVYVVCGKRPYRGHQPGVMFEAALDAGAEQRAVARGDIRLLERTTPTVQAGAFSLPEGWADPPDQESSTTTTEARASGLSHSRR